MAETEYRRLSIDGCKLVAHAASEKAKRRALKTYGGCEHEKPLFANGRARKFCFDCLQKPPKKITEAACALCGTLFSRNTAHAIYCSVKCRCLVSSRRQQEAALDRRTRNCETCLAPFTPAYGVRIKRHCSPACHRRAYNATRSGTSNRRRAKRYGSDWEFVNKLKVFARDGWKCYLCGCDTPRENQGKRLDNAPELDHVQPLAKGGAHSYANTACACRRCNRCKGSQVLSVAMLAAGAAGQGN